MGHLTLPLPMALSIIKDQEVIVDFDIFGNIEMIISSYVTLKQDPTG